MGPTGGLGVGPTREYKVKWDRLVHKVLKFKVKYKDLWVLKVKWDMGRVAGLTGIQGEMGPIWVLR
jgi:hypothetical protein